MLLGDVTSPSVVNERRQLDLMRAAGTDPFASRKLERVNDLRFLFWRNPGGAMKVKSPRVIFFGAKHERNVATELLFQAPRASPVKPFERVVLTSCLSFNVWGQVDGDGTCDFVVCGLHRPKQIHERKRLRNELPRRRGVVPEG